MKRSKVVVSAVGGIAVVSLICVTPAAAAPPDSGGLVTAQVTVAGMQLVDEASSTGLAQHDSATDLASDIPEGAEPVTFTVTAPAAELDAIIDARAAEIEERQNDALSAALPAGTEISPYDSHEVFGTCGSSRVVLRTTTSQTQGQAYVEASFSLLSSVVLEARAYTTDVLVYSNSATDLWTAHLQASGPDLNALSWKKGTRYTVPKTQKYGAHFYVGSVAVLTTDRRTATCSTIGPRVDNVLITVSS